MKSRPFLALCLFLLLPFNSFALEPLPVADLAAVDDAISRPLRGLLDDYLQLLPGQTALSYARGDGSTRSWSTHHDELSRACRTSPEACAPVLRAEFDALSRDWQQVISRGTFTLRDGALISALSDLCEVAGFLEMGDRCHEKYSLATLASMGWLRLANDHLFLAYQDRDLAERGQMSSWLVHEATLLPEEREEGLKRLERDSRAEERDTYALELRIGPSAAYSLWFKLLMQRFSRADDQGALTALVNLSRLAAEKGQEEWAETWWSLGQELLAGKPALQESNRGALLGQRFRIDVALARRSHAPVDGVRRQQELLGQKLPFTAQTVEYALLALREGEQGRARDALKLARDACGKIDGCGVTRLGQITALLALAEGDSAGLRRLGEQWQGRLRAEMLLVTELQIAWAVADRLRETGALVEAAALYKALDEQVESGRSRTFGNAADLARFDDLKRMRVRVDVDLGTRVPLQEMESLRGQGLLQRLRYQRWFKELGGTDDPVARAELERQLAGVQRDRQKLGALAAQASPLGRTIYRATLQEFDGIETALQYAYLNDLAARKTKANWLTRSQALYWYQFAEGFDPFGGAITALRNDEAYLSWLQVPGGYVATSLAVTPRDLVTDRDYGGTFNSVRQRFIPFTTRDEAVLQLYRDLLQAGAGARRGRVSLAATEKKGLTMNGQPLWLSVDGSFAVGLTAPTGGRRLETFASLRDALYERLLAPFARHYQDARLLIISPDGPLAFLPFETLTRQGVPVLETLDIGYVQSLAVYAELKKRVVARRQVGEPGLLSVADPLYAPSAPGATGPVSGARGSLEGGSWPPLPGTLVESAAITGLYRNSRQLLGAEASKGSLADMQVRKLLKGFSILHFATHGYVDDEQSALVLSAGSTPESAYLLDSDIAGWDLDSDLVLLSACNTGVGRHQSGEGVVGLPYAFFMAGNLNTLMSLWSVDDAGTAALIPAFMQRVHQGEDQVSALNNTKRAFDRGDFGEILRDPRVWSAFVLYGAPLGRGN